MFRLVQARISQSKLRTSNHICWRLVARRRLCKFVHDEASKVDTGRKSVEVEAIKVKRGRVRGRNRNGRIYGSSKFDHRAYTAPQESIKSVREALQKLDENFKYRGFHTLRWVGLASGIGFLFTYGFKDDIKENIGSTGAEITSRTLGDQEVQKQARELARGVVYELLNDDRALELTTSFLNDVLNREYTRQAVLKLLGHVASLESTQTMLADLFKRILKDEYFMAQVSASFSNLITMDATKDASSKLIASLLADPANQQLMAEFYQRVSETNAFRDSSSQVGIHVAHSVMNNQEVNQRAVEWARSVLGEPDLHTQAGDAMWEAIRTTFIPGFLGGGRPKKINIKLDSSGVQDPKNQKDPTYSASAASKDIKAAKAELDAILVNETQKKNRNGKSRNEKGNSDNSAVSSASTAAATEKQAEVAVEEKTSPNLKESVGSDEKMEKDKQ
mmetsp:Transcript_12459/g.16163  ORF Transcript_12459/g.16163 Transcript_12459/m.16163 type:complete len:447 (-) Transcript_12459:51-1391(-)